MGGIWAEDFMKLPKEIIRIQTHKDNKRVQFK